jgi:hypothetical protein
MGDYVLFWLIVAGVFFGQVFFRKNSAQNVNFNDTCAVDRE